MTITPPAQVDAATLAKTLRATFDSGRTRPLAWREAQLAGLRRMMEEGEDELLEALRVDLGRPQVEAFAADIGHTKQELRHLAKHVERLDEAHQGAHARPPSRRPRAGSCPSRSAWRW